MLMSNPSIVSDSQRRPELSPVVSALKDSAVCAPQEPIADSQTDKEVKMSKTEAGTLNCLHCDECFGSEEDLQKHSRCHAISNADSKGTLSLGEVNKESGKTSKKSRRKSYVSLHSRSADEPQIEFSPVVMPDKETNEPEDTTADSQTLSVVKMSKTGIAASSHKCVLCNQSLGTKEELQEHFRRHANQEIDIKGKPRNKLVNGECDVIKKESVKKITQVSIEAESSDNRNTVCDICGAEFRTVSLAISHKFRKHPNSAVKYYCPHCGMMFPIKINRENHIKTHPAVNPKEVYPCLACNVSFFNLKALKFHVDSAHKGFAESILTCASIESLGQKIKQAAQSNLNKQLSTINEQTEMASSMEYTMSQSTMEAIEAIDNAIDEALDDEPTPPKRQRTLENESNVYKTPKINPGSPSRNTEDQSSLAHSISMYRKQKPDVLYTPVRQIVRHPDLRSPTPEPPESPSVTVSARIRELQQEVAEQQRVISQASNAVTVVLQHTEHQGTPQHVEAEKLLLLSTQKRQSALDEIQRLKTEGAMAQSSWSSEEDTCRGSISISNISVPLKQDFIKRGMNGNEVYHLIVLVKHREQVISSQLMATPSCVVDCSVTFPNLMSLHNLASDFIISLEVYALRTLSVRHHAIKKEQSRMKLTPLKRLQKNESRVATPSSVQSPGGPFAVRSSSFQLVGFTHLNISTLTRNAWTLEKVPFSSPLDGHLLMHVSCSFEGGITERGFLTMFEDIGGFGAWNRRWCVLSGMYLRYWRYPDDESRKEAIGQVDLRSCTTRRVELVSRDVCARQHTFQLICLRPAYSGDASNLVQEVQGSSVATKHLLSADSKEERIEWCNKLNKSLANIRAWDPDALRPEDYQV